MKVDAETFIERVSEKPDQAFVFRQNPFMKDIANKNFEHVEGPKCLEIVPDYDSLRISTWTKN